MHYICTTMANYDIMLHIFTAHIHNVCINLSACPGLVRPALVTLSHPHDDQSWLSFFRRTHTAAMNRHHPVADSPADVPLRERRLSRRWRRGFVSDGFSSGAWLDSRRRIGEWAGESAATLDDPAPVITPSAEHLGTGHYLNMRHLRDFRIQYFLFNFYITTVLHF